MHVALNNKTVAESHPARGAWIEIKIIQHQHTANYGRTPQGVRGLKLKSALAADFDKSRTPQGVRGLKFDGAANIVSPAGSRTPQGVRGLKFYAHFLCLRRDESHPARGAWIEICLRVTAGTGLAVSHPARGAWIEISCFGLYGSLLAMSHPARGAWIEIPWTQII